MRPEAQQWGILNYAMLTSSLSALGQHERELDEARRARARFPDNGGCILMEARALASVGRTGELDALIDATLSQPVSTGSMMQAVARRLHATDHTSEARAMWARAADWIRDRPEEEQKGLLDILAGACLHSGQFDAAEGLVKERLAALAAPTAVRQENREKARLQAEGNLGVIAALRGDGKGAVEASDRIRRLHKMYLFGEDHYQRARIAAQLGDLDAAVQLLRAALADGYFVWNTPIGVAFRDEPAFDSLRGYAPYEELVKPKG